MIILALKQLKGYKRHFEIDWDENGITNYVRVDNTAYNSHFDIAGV
jgi:hypothetical protein